MRLAHAGILTVIAVLVPAGSSLRARDDAGKAESHLWAVDP